MTSLICADIHLTSNPREEERWGLLPWLEEQARKYDCAEVLLLGDGTDAKDKHSAKLVNRMHAAIDQYYLNDVNFVWLMGNHDHIDASTPFFEFLADPYNGVHFIKRPQELQLSIGKCIFLPSTAHWEEDWKNLDFQDYDYAFAHQTFSGAVSETGYKLIEGVPPTTLDGVRYKAYSGDIHVPQKFGKKGEYVGAPYRVRFGDTYEGRVLMVGRDKKGHHQQQDLHYPTKGKHLVTIRNIDDLDMYKVPEGGNTKIRIKVSRGDLPLWQETKEKVRAEAIRMGWDVHDIELVRTDVGGTEDGTVKLKSTTASPKTIFNDYCKAKGAPIVAVECGHTVLKELSRD